MTNEEFKEIMKLDKVFEEEQIELPGKNESGIFNIDSLTTNDKFYLDVDRRGRIELTRCKMQERLVKTKLPLVRIDIDSPPHMNPDGSGVGRNHIHIYREEEFDTGNLPWAYELEGFAGIKINDFQDFMDIFYVFCNYCNIKTNNVQGVM